MNHDETRERRYPNGVFSRSYFPILWTTHSCWQRGHRLFCLTHRDIQQLWNEWLQSPQTTTQSSCLFSAWHLRQASITWTRQIAHVSHSTSQLHMATPFHFFSWNIFAAPAAVDGADVAAEALFPSVIDSSSIFSSAIFEDFNRFFQKRILWSRWILVQWLLGRRQWRLWSRQLPSSKQTWRRLRNYPNWEAGPPARRRREAPHGPDWWVVASRWRFPTPLVWLWQRLPLKALLFCHQVW